MCDCCGDFIFGYSAFAELIYCSATVIKNKVKKAELASPHFIQQFTLDAVHFQLLTVNSVKIQDANQGIVSIRRR